MRCEELKELVPLHLIDLLEPAEESALREHLDGGCPRCSAELAAAREVAGHLPFALPAEEPSPMVRARLLAAIRAEQPAVARTGATLRAGWWVTLAASAAAALAAGVITGGAMLLRHRAVTAELQARLDEQSRQIEQQNEQVVMLRHELREAKESIQMVSSPAVTIANLSGQKPQPSAVARVFWDSRHEAWRLYTASLPPAAPGKTYQLWLITPTAKISAGTFDPAEGESAAGRVVVPSEAGKVVAAAVTDEPEGGSPQPTGSILLLGEI